jgi:hypothetical protein
MGTTEEAKMETETTHSVNTASKPHTSGHGVNGAAGFNNCYATASIGVTDDSGRLVAFYKRQSEYGGSRTEMYYSLDSAVTDDNPNGIVNFGTMKAEGGVRIADWHPAPGTYRNQRVAFAAQIKALYGLEVK